MLNPLFQAQANIRRWKAIANFCAARAGDYAELAGLELAETKATVLRELISMVALAVGVLFTLSFLCFALIATAFGTPYFLAVVWAIAGIWLIVSVAAFFTMRTQLRGANHFGSLQSELREDLKAIKEAL
ncbi:phage holin family protein [Burkholderia sp. PAMC 26561]|uniref:phage holin family protein n=1 Tax=Burkholderia sp. PAMC 26561 TaxID=1795043 RepID=UPI000A66214A|nr:phage holin family protein [Burkholderia sp. PAMC 26561]